MKIGIIGAGPAGNYSAFLLAKFGHQVQVYERDPVIGRPVQCTGILSDYFETILRPQREFIVNTVDRTRIYAPDGQSVEARIKKNYVICRSKFDNYLADLAKDAGANYSVSTSFKGFGSQEDRLRIKVSKGSQESAAAYDILIGADGPLSPVAKAAGLYGNRKFVIGTQVEARMENDNAVEFYPYIGCYAWIVPTDEETVRIGVAAYKDSPELFRKFVKEKIGKDYDKKILENQSGVIPVFNPCVKAQKGNIYLNGDAATFVKATTGGGINQSLKGAIALSESITKGLDYDTVWRKSMYHNLHAHLIAHKMMQRFTENDWNSLIETFSQEKMKKILYSESRDNLMHMLSRIALARPDLVRYAKYFPVEELKYLL